MLARVDGGVALSMSSTAVVVQVLSQLTRVSPLSQNGAATFDSSGVHGPALHAPSRLWETEFGLSVPGMGFPRSSKPLHCIAKFVQYESPVMV